MFTELRRILTSRVAAAKNGDSSGLLDDIAAAEAGQLAMATQDDAQAAVLLATFYWFRHLASESPACLDDLRSAVRLTGGLLPLRWPDLPMPLCLLAAADPDAQSDIEDWYVHAGTLLESDPDPDVVEGLIGILEVVRRCAEGELRVRALVGLAIAHSDLLNSAPSFDRLSSTITAGARAAETMAVDAPQRWMILFNLAHNLRVRFAATGDLHDLDAAITASAEAAEANPSMALTRSALAIGLRTRHGLTGDVADLAGAVEHGRAALDLFADDDPEEAVTLVHTARALHVLGSTTGSPADIDEGVRYALQACVTTDGARYADAASVLVDLRIAKFEQSTALEDLDLIERTLRQVLARNATADLQDKLAMTLNTRFFRTGDLCDLDEAACLYRTLADSCDAGDSRRYRLGAAVSVLLRGEVGGSLGDLVAGVLDTATALSDSPGEERPDLSGLREALRDFGSTGEPGVLLRLDVVAVAERLLIVNEAPRDLEARLLVGWSLWLRARHLEAHAEREGDLAVSLFRELYLVAPWTVPLAMVEVFQQKPPAYEDQWRENELAARRVDEVHRTGDVSALRFTVSQIRQRIDTAPEHHLAPLHNNLAIALAHLGSVSGDPGLMAEAVDAIRRSVQLSDPADHDLPGRLSMLCQTLTSLYALTREPELIAEARRSGESSVTDTPAGHRSRGMHRAALCAALVAEYQLRGDVEAMERVIHDFRDVLVLLPPGHRHHVPGHLRFTEALSELSSATNRVELLVEAEQVLRRMAATTRDALRLQVLSRLAATTRRLHDLTGDRSHLVNEVAVGRELVATTPCDDSAFFERVSAFAGCSSQLYLEIKDPDLLDEGIAALMGAQSAPGPDDPTVRGSRKLAILLRWRARDREDEASLWEAERTMATAIRSAPGDADLLAEHAQVLIELHRSTGQSGALASAIDVGADALRLTGADDPERLHRARMVVDALQTRYNLVGDRGALERGIALARAELDRDPAPGSPWAVELSRLLIHSGEISEAVDHLRAFRAAAESGHPDGERASNALGYALISLYLTTNVVAFLREAIELHRESARNGSISAKNSLALALHLLHRRTGAPEALDEAISVGAELVSQSPDQVNRAMHLGNLADYLSSEWRATGDAAVREECVSLARAAVVASGSNLAVRADNLARLVQLLLARSEGEPGRTAEAVGMARQSVDISDKNGRSHSMQMTILGSALLSHGMEHADKAAIEEARDVLSSAARMPLAPPGERINTSERWAQAAMLLGDAEDAEDAYHWAIDLMVEHTGPALSLPDRQHGLDQAVSLPGDAAACALAAGHPDRAIAFLEKSRGLLLAEALHARIDLNDLAKASPRLAEDFHRVSTQLRELDRLQTTSHGDGPEPAWLAHQRYDLGREWDSIRERIRETPGFETFLLPPPLSAVCEATRGGHAVVVNVSQWRCDAIVIGDELDVVALPGLSMAECVARANEYLLSIHYYQAAVRALVSIRRETASGDPDAYRSYQDAKDAAYQAHGTLERTLSKILEWLWDAVAEPVVNHLGLTAEHRGRLWWCPIGPLSVLPLHAADSRRDGARNLHEVAVSSYTPTLRALVPPRTPPSADPDLGMLVVSIPTTPGQPPLPNATRERNHLRALFPACCVLDGAEATRNGVLDAMKRHSWIHLSCHGEQIVESPANSRLLLADGPLTVARIIEEKPCGQFAFLSACKTATTGATLLNEMISMASALHYAGYRHIIATLWTVHDAVAADVAAAAYDELTATGRFEPAHSATALHNAVHRFRRQYPDQPSVWTPFIHIGA